MHGRVDKLALQVAAYKGRAVNFVLTGYYKDTNGDMTMDELVWRPCSTQIMPHSQQKLQGCTPALR